MLPRLAGSGILSGMSTLPEIKAAAGALPAEERSALVAWLSESETVPLEDGTASFHELAAHWLEGAALATESDALISRFFALLSSNAEDYWQVPELPFASRAKTL